ncbi:MAG: nucleotidyltransferase substrate binding protein [Crocinitomicaceae bacterium]|nr:nucleotidyltransferase substrate binding protein [Crocinitomicaceae bacterium]MBK8925437.1 nucleotidyltransferase substrate binding protein [Crocinitomicaceae bacterium]
MRQENDIRWKQRFSNFEKAFLNLEFAVSLKNPSKVEKAGLIQFYEFTFELAWKTMKDFLESKSLECKFPRDTIKEAFRYELISNGDDWMDMLEKRNLMAHTYDEKTSDIAYHLIVDKYFQSIKIFYDLMKSYL